MSKVAEIVEGSVEEMVGKTAKAASGHVEGRVTNVLKDGNSGPPILFRHTSMQKIRHCCQNQNLFPYLLYSFDNSKTHPMARRVHLCLDELLDGIIARVFFLHQSLRQYVLRGIQTECLQAPAPLPVPTPAPAPPKENYGDDAGDATDKPTSKFRTLERQKRKQTPLFLTMAVYLTPLFLAFQLIGLCSLMIFGKYTPGFIFLFTALLFLGGISLRIMFHETMVHRVKCERSKAH